MTSGPWNLRIQTEGGASSVPDRRIEPAAASTRNKERVEACFSKRRYFV